MVLYLAVLIRTRVVLLLGEIKDLDLTPNPSEKIAYIEKMLSIQNNTRILFQMPSVLSRYPRQFSFHGIYRIVQCC
jgi:hypothetical protein